MTTITIAQTGSAGFIVITSTVNVLPCLLCVTPPPAGASAAPITDRWLGIDNGGGAKARGGVGVGGAKNLKAIQAVMMYQNGR